MSKMDEVNAHIHQQSSISSDSNGEETPKVESIPLPLDKRICLVGSLINDNAVCKAAQTFGVPVITSEHGFEYVDEKFSKTVFVLDPFDDDVYNTLCKHRQSILGPIALQQLANKKEKLPDNTRPLYNLAMTGVVVCFTGFRNKDDLTRLVPLVHHMGGSIRKDMSAKVTHLIANVSGGDKYQYAATFKVPVVHQSWVVSSWEQRNDLEFNATIDVFVAQHKLKPFHGARVCFLGFPEEEENHMTEVLEANGGTLTKIDDPACSHVVKERSAAYVREPASDLLSPKPDSETAVMTPTNTVIPSTCISPSQYVKESTQNLKTPSKNRNLLETLYEQSHDNYVDPNDTCLDDTIVTQCAELNKTSSSAKRKRKDAISPDTSFLSKRRRDLSYSENTRKKISSLFRTPIEYLSNRRRTINGPTMNQNLNSSVVSSSGVFDVHITENLAYCGKTDSTPNSILRTSLRGNRNVKKNLFTRTFSSTKFKKRYKRKSRVTDLNASDASEIDGRDNINVSCFPDISSCIAPDELQLRATTQPDTPGPLIHTVVLTSLHHSF